MRSEQRLHPLSFLFIIGSHAKGLLIPGLLVLLAARSATWEVWLMLLFIPYAVWSIIKYLGFRYIYADDELIIRTGFIFKNERHVPYTRIQNIGLLQNLLHRLLGVAEVRVETAGGQEPEAHLRVLSLKAMEEMRRRVFDEKRRSQVVQAGAAGSPAGEASTAESPQDPAARTLLHLPLRELVVYGLIHNRGMVVAAAVLGLAWEFGWRNLDFPISFDLPDSVWIREKIGMAPRLASPLIYAALGITSLVLLVITLRILSIGWAVVRLYDFTLQLAGRDLRLSCGLFTKVFTSIPLYRIQRLSIRETFLHRLFGRVEVKVDTAGGSQAEEASVTHQRLAPLIRKGDLPKLLQEVQPDIDLESAEWLPVDPRARKRLLKTWLIIVGLITLTCVTVAGWRGLTVLVPLLPLAHANARLQAAHMGYALTPAAVLFRSGWLWRYLSVARYNKIQTLAMTQSPFDRRYRMATVRVDTAGAGSSAHQIRVPFLDMETARQIRNHLEARAAETAFRW